MKSLHKHVYTPLNYTIEIEEELSQNEIIKCKVVSHTLNPGLVGKDIELRTDDFYTFFTSECIYDDLQTILQG